MPVIALTELLPVARATIELALTLIVEPLTPAPVPRPAEMLAMELVVEALMLPVLVWMLEIAAGAVPTAVMPRTIELSEALPVA